MFYHLRYWLIVCLCALVWTGAATAADHQVEKIEEGPPTGELSDEIAAQLSDTGLRVKRGSRTVVEIWPCKQWKISPDVATSGQRLYPFEQGQLIGVARYPRDGADFRDQEIESGVYTLRYGLQPVDGNHIGTSPTLDFFLLLSPEQDKSTAPLPPEELHQQSAEAIGTLHPAILCLQKRREQAEQRPTMLHDEIHDWWLLRFENMASANGETKQVAVDLVVVGVAVE